MNFYLKTMLNDILMSGEKQFCQFKVEDIA